MDEIDETSASITRRKLLQKAAVGGAIVWTAPILTSAVAHGQAISGPPGGECDTTTLVKINSDGSIEFVPGGGVNEQCPPLACAPTGNYEALRNALLSSSWVTIPANESYIEVDLTAIDGFGGCTIIGNAVVKAGSPQSLGTDFCVTVSVPANLQFSHPFNDTISHVLFCLCCSANTP